MLGQWRDVVSFYGTPPGALRHDVDRRHPRRPRHPRRGQLSRRRGRTSAGTSPRTRRSACPSRRSRSFRASTRRSSSRSTTRRRTSIGSAIGSTRIDYESDKVNVEYVDVDRQPARAKQAEVTAVRHDRHRVQGSDAARHEHRGAGHHQRPHQGRDRQGEEGLLHAGPRRAGHRGVRSPRATTPITAALGRDNFTVDEPRARAAAGGARRRDGGRRSPVRRPTFSRRRSTR